MATSYLSKESWPFTIIISIVWLQVALVFGICIEMMKGQSPAFALFLLLVVGLWAAIAVFSQLIYNDQKARKKYPTTVLVMLLLAILPTLAMVIAPALIGSGASLNDALAAIFIPLFLAVPILVILIAFIKSNNKPRKTKQR